MRKDERPTSRESSSEWVICPWCGFHDVDVFEYKRGDYYCESCDKEFHVEVSEVVTWTTTPNVYAEEARAAREAP